MVQLINHLMDFWPLVSRLYSSTSWHIVFWSGPRDNKETSSGLWKRPSVRNSLVQGTSSHLGPVISALNDPPLNLWWYMPQVCSTRNCKESQGVLMQCSVYVQLTCDDGGRVCIIYPVKLSKGGHCEPWHGYAYDNLDRLLGHRKTYLHNHNTNMHKYTQIHTHTTTRVL